MKLSSSLSLLLASSVAYAVVPLPKPGTVTSQYVPDEFIVEMTSLQGLAGKRAFTTPHQELYNALRKRDIPFDIKTEYNEPGIIVGAAMKLASSGDVVRVAEIPGVVAIRPVVIIPGPRRINQFPVSDPKDSRLPPDSFSTHVMTGVDKVHAKGINGKGIKIGIIDTGIDYTHPSLGKGFGPGHKVIGGFDFVGDAYTGSNQPQPDNDPMDNCNGHGTHVAGIIGADPGNKFGVQGVSYGASISAYRVFGCTGSVTDDIIITALLRGNSDGMDILTLSLGGSDGWTESSSSIVASRLAASGKVVTIAAGNDGGFGSWYTSSPGNGIDVISVASVDNVVIPIQNATVKGVSYPGIPYLQTIPFDVPGDLPIYATSTDVTKVDDACSPLPADTPDLSGFVVIIHRGSCSFVQKMDNAAAKGGKLFLIYNSDTGAFSPIAVGNYKAALITAEDGKFLVAQFAAKAPITLSFANNPFDYPSETGGLMSSFSSFGPTFDMFFKPAVAAPGGNILSTLPLALGAFGVESGTSMATPFTAGAAALILQSKGKSKNVATGLRSLLQTTAGGVRTGKEQSDPFQTVSQQGAGLIQVNDAISTKTIVTPGQLTLNDTAHFNGKQTIKIQNTGSKPVTYKLKHVPAGTAVSVKNEVASVSPVPLSSDFATVKFSSSSITVKAGQTAQVQVSFTAAHGDPKSYPVYSGFVEISSLVETLKVTYLGVASSLKDKTILDTSNTFFGVTLPAFLDATGQPQSTDSEYTLIGTDVPSVLYRLNFGSPTIQLHLVDKNTNFNPTLTKRDALAKRSWWSWFWGHFFGNSTFDNVKTKGILAEFDYVPRNSNDPDPSRGGYSLFTLRSTFANGNKIPNGEYKVLARALRVTGNPKKEADFESWLSPAFTVKA